VLEGQAESLNLSNQKEQGKKKKRKSHDPLGPGNFCGLKRNTRDKNEARKKESKMP